MEKASSNILYIRYILLFVLLTKYKVFCYNFIAYINSFIKYIIVECLIQRVQKDQLRHLKRLHQLHLKSSSIHYYKVFH